MLRQQVRFVSLVALVAGSVSCSGSVGSQTSDGASGGSGGEAGRGGGAGGAQANRSDVSFACNKDASPGEIRMRRLTKVQYENTLADLVRFALGDDDTAAKAVLTSVASSLAKVPSEPRALVPKSPIHGFYRRASQEIQQEHADGYYAVGLAAAAALTSPSNMPRLLGACSSQLNVSACIDSFIDKFGQRALRRPLEASDKAKFRAIYGSGTTLDAPALADTIAVILNNPAFLFQIEHGGAASAVKDSFGLSPFELASRLSYHFWQTMPDDLLWQAAVSGSLATPEGYERQVDRLFDDTKTRVTMDSFIDEWFRLEGVKTIKVSAATPAEKKFLGASVQATSLEQNMRTEVVDLARHLIFETNASARDLLTTDLSFAKTDDLRGIYGIAGSAPIRFGNAKRPGLFTRAAFLANGTVRTRPVMKGVFLRTEILCDELPAPPANAVNAKLEGDVSQMTTRAETEALTETEGSACAVCHRKLINPLGFATENFDSLGRERSEETFFDKNGNQVGSKPINTTANAAVVADDEPAIASAAELMTRIADSGKVEACLARQYFRFAFARWEDEERDGCMLEALRTAAGSGGSVKDMLRRVALADAFKQRTFE